MESMGLRIGSLFSGIGGLELGLEWAGVGHTVYQCEADEHARRVLARHWPGIPCYPDVRTLAGERDLPDCDVLCGGFPCQETSVANARGNVTGARSGLDGARSGLWWSMADVIATQRPEWVVVENVSHGAGKWLPDVRAWLDGEGYESLPVPLEARFVGLPHLRRRVFLLAHADGFPVWEHQQWLPGGRPEGVRDGGHAESLEHGEPRGRGAQPSLSALDDGIPHGLGGPYYRAIGNAAVPQCAEIIGWMIRELSGGAQ
jgi:DNA (cytosine-5)-methyltransferase 1